MHARARSTSVLVAIAATLVPLLAQSAHASPPPFTPRTLESSVEACANAKAGDRCTMQLEQQETHGVYVVFTRSELVCAADAPK